jgi:hypothetical protein
MSNYYIERRREAKPGDMFVRYDNATAMRLCISSTLGHDLYFTFGEFQCNDVPYITKVCDIKQARCPENLWCMVHWRRVCELEF